MTIKKLLVFGAVGMFAFLIMILMLFFFLSMFTYGTRTAQSDVGLGDESRWLNEEKTTTIAISRPHHIIPREVLFRDIAYHKDAYKEKYAPFRFWLYHADPSFNSNNLSYFQFLGLDNLGVNSAVQGFHINQKFSDPKHREDVMAIRTNTQIVDYPTPGFQYSKAPGNFSQFHFIGQNGVDMYFYYPFASDNSEYNKKHHKNVEGLVHIKLPLKSGTAKIVKSDAVEKWHSSVETLRSIDLYHPSFHSLCADKLRESHDFAHRVFGKSCNAKSPTKDHAIDDKKILLGKDFPTLN